MSTLFIFVFLKKKRKTFVSCSRAFLPLLHCFSPPLTFVLILSMYVIRKKNDNNNNAHEYYETE